MADGASAILAERQRQIAEEGWSLEHDDGHDDGAIAIVAARLCLAHTDADVRDPDDVGGDPWALLAKHRDTIRRLTIAGALIAAEIDRLKRLKEPTSAD